MKVPIAWLNKAAVADVALKELSSYVKPYVVPNVAELMRTQTALPADQHLSLATSIRVPFDKLVEIGV